MGPGLAIPGNIRIIDPSNGGACTSVSAATTEVPLDWNQQGPGGPQGPQGLLGLQGPQGQPGPAGQPGTSGTVSVPTGSGQQALSLNVLAFASTGTPTSGGSASGRATHSEFTITKLTDSASPSLFQDSVSGKRFPSATLSLRKSGGQTVLRYDLANVLVSAYQVNSSGPGRRRGTETITFSFTGLRP